MRLQIFATFVGLALCSGLCPGQAFPPSRGATGYTGSVVTTSTLGYTQTAVTGAPYSAEQVGGIVGLPSGVHTPNTFVWRDSDGRTRTEREAYSTRGAKWPRSVEIRDPVAGVVYILDTKRKVAHRIKLQPPLGSAQASAAPSLPAAIAAAQNVPPSATAAAQSQTGVVASSIRPERKSESLGTRMIDGILAEGTRYTTTHSASATGYGAPVVVTSENWTSVDLKVSVLSTSGNSLGGETSMKLINIKREEPDSGLFRPPAGYKIVEETGPVVTFRY